jgi:hypothetical protein
MEKSEARRRLRRCWTPRPASPLRAQIRTVVMRFVIPHFAMATLAARRRNERPRGSHFRPTDDLHACQHAKANQVASDSRVPLALVNARSRFSRRCVSTTRVSTSALSVRVRSELASRLTPVQQPPQTLHLDRHFPRLARTAWARSARRRHFLAMSESRVAKCPGNAPRRGAGCALGSKC